MAGPSRKTASCWASVMLVVAVQHVFADGEWSPDSNDRPSNLPMLRNLDVACYKNHMTVTAEFNAPFSGTIFSKGNSGQQGCVYVAPNTRKKQYQFDIRYDTCGTKPDLNGRLFENTIVVQYGSDLIEVWDEAKRLRCEWFNEYQKTQAANPPVLIDDLEEIHQEFVGDHVEVWMEIQEGQGPWASQVSGIVPLGSTLTLVVAIKDDSNEFDMLVHSCVASDGVRQPLLLTDDAGCVMRSKMFGPFHKMRVQDARATVITYAHFKAFKFPDALSVQMQCRVIICRNACQEHCQKSATIAQSRTNDIASQSQQPEAMPLQQEETDARESAKVTAEKDDKVHVSEVSNPSEVHHDVTSNQNAANHKASSSFGNSEFVPPPVGPRNLRIRRSNSGGEFGVAQTFQAISRTDLAFSPSAADQVGVLEGHVNVDGVFCLPSVQFALIFIVLAGLTVLAIGAASILTYRYCTRTSGKQACAAVSVPATVAHLSNGTVSLRNRTKVH